jgi:hypothetical protein
MAHEMSFIPKGTMIEETDGINRVTLTFPTLEDAIVFHQMLLSIADGEMELTLVKPGSR